MNEIALQVEVNNLFLFFSSAIHNWKGNVSHGLPLDVGDFVEIYEECGPWLRGSCSRKPRSIGIFPKSFVHVKDPSKEDPVVSECTQGKFC
jgi:dedicator of cytokinesis protein 3